MSPIVSILYPQHYDVLYGPKRLPRFVQAYLPVTIRLPEKSDLETVAFFSNPGSFTEELRRDGDGKFWRFVCGHEDGVRSEAVETWFKNNCRRLHVDHIPRKVRAVARGAKVPPDEPQDRLPDGQHPDSLPNVREISPRQDFNETALQMALDQLKEFAICENLLVRRCVEPVLQLENSHGGSALGKVEFLSGTSLTRNGQVWRLDALDDLRRSWGLLGKEMPNGLFPGVHVDVERPDLLAFDHDLHRARLAATQATSNFRQRRNVLNDASAEELAAFVWLRDALAQNNWDIDGYVRALVDIGWKNPHTEPVPSLFGTILADMIDQAHLERAEDFADEDVIALLPRV